MKKVLLVIALVLTLAQASAYTQTVTLIQPGDTGRMLVPSGWNVNASSLEDKVNLALALNRQGCYFSAYHLFQRNMECMLWLNFPVYANKSIYIEGTPAKQIGILKVYGGTKRVSVKKTISLGRQWLEFAADESTSRQYSYKPGQTASRHYSYLTTSSYNPAAKTSHVAVNHVSYSMAGSQTTIMQDLGNSEKSNQTAVRHYTYYHPTKPNQTVMRHYTYYSRSRQPARAGSTAKANVYSRYYRRARQYS